MHNSYRISCLLAFIVGAAFLYVEWSRAHYFLMPNQSSAIAPRWASLIQTAEWAASDLAFKVRGPQVPHPDIVIIGVDEASLTALHQWPWPRSIHARLIRVLEKDPPKALIFDILFIEPFTTDAKGDAALVSATQDNPWVIHSLFFEMQDDQIVSVRLPFSKLLNAAAHVGSVNAMIDEDGTLRRAMPQMKVAGQTVSLLSVEAASLYQKMPLVELVQKLPLDPKGRLLVNFVGKDYSYPYLSYADILSGKIPASYLKDKIVLVGASATGTFDHYPTPTSKFMPGVEFHANVIDNILRWNQLRYAGIRWTYLAIAIATVLCGVFLARWSPGIGALGALISALGYAGFGQWLFVRRYIQIDFAGPLLTLLMGYLVILIYRFFTEEKEKRWVKAAFGQYVSHKVLDVLMEDPTKLRLGGDRREMTVLFSDVAGFTSISERLDPQELVGLLNQYLTAMTEVVFQFDGYLNKYMGDGIMAFWNAPVRQVNHAELACRCALRSRDRLVELNKDLEKRGLIPLKARIGLNTGVMVVGNMGSSQKSDYTVMGDNVNLGSRLEGANKAFGSSIMISEFTYQVVQDLFEVRFLDIMRVPGKAKPVKTYELLAEKGAITADWRNAIPLYHQGIQLFADRSFQEAKNKFLDVLSIIPQDKPSEMYIQRAEMFLAHPPSAEWDGVFELKVK